jgi:Phage-related minor tail protein
MSNLNLDLRLQFENAGGQAAAQTLRQIAQAGTQTAASLTALSSGGQAAAQAFQRAAQAGTQAAASLNSVGQSSSAANASLTALSSGGQAAAQAFQRAAQAGTQAASNLTTLGQSAAQSTAAQRSNAGAALNSAAALSQLTTNTNLSSSATRNNAQAALQSAASLRTLSGSAAQQSVMMQRATVEMAQLIASTRQATQAQLDLSSALRDARPPPRYSNPWDWLPKVLAESKALQATFNTLKVAGMAIGAGVAVKSAVGGDFKQVMAYDLRLAHAANTAYAGSDLAGRQAGAKKLDAAVMSAARSGGGTREAALDAADSLIARGAVGNAATVYKLLPSITKTATAGNAKTTEIAQIVSASVKQGGIAPDRIDKTLGMALYAGQQGGFEIDKMAKWLPQHITMASMAGIRGESGMAKILALNEMAVNSSGTQDEAGNNVRDFLHELNASNTANHLKRFSLNKSTGYLEERLPGERKKGRNYVDLGHTLAANQEKGIDAIDSIIGITRLIAESDPKFRAAKIRYDAAKASGDKGGQTESSQAVFQILMGRGVSKLFHNQQSLMGGINAIMNPEEYHRMSADILKNGDVASIDKNHAMIAATTSYKVEDKTNEEANALQAGLAGATGWLGKYSESLAHLYKANPQLASSIETMTVAAKGATAALAALAGMALMSRGLGAAGGAAGAGWLSGAAIGGAAVFGAKLLAAGAAGYAVGNYAVAPALDWMAQKASGKKDTSLGGSLYDLIYGDAHEKNMARKPEVPSPLSAVFKRDWVSEAGASQPLADPLAKFPQLSAPNAQGQFGQNQSVEQMMRAMPQAQPIQITTQLHLDGNQIANVVNDINGRQAARH